MISIVYARRCPTTPKQVASLVRLYEAQAEALGIQWDDDDPRGGTRKPVGECPNCHGIEPLTNGRECRQCYDIRVKRDKRMVRRMTGGVYLPRMCDVPV